MHTAGTPFRNDPFLKTQLLFRLFCAYTEGADNECKAHDRWRGECAPYMLRFTGEAYPDGVECTGEQSGMQRERM